MKKRILILSVLLAVCLLVSSLAGCDLLDSVRSSGSGGFDDNTVYTTVAGMNYAYSPYYPHLRSRYSYDQLNDLQQKLYDRLLNVVLTVSPDRDAQLGTYPMKVVRVSGTLSIAQIRVVIRALTNDNPYVFWLSQSFSHLIDHDSNYVEVVTYSEFSPVQLAGFLQQTDAAISDFYASVPSGMTPYQCEKYVHDYIINNCEYDREIAALTEVSEQNIKGHSIYGALVDGHCVCEGYGMAMQLLLNGLGVECVTLTGESFNSSADELRQDSVLHLWNAVRLDGEWYHVDPTWDDQTEQIQRYVYFNLSDNVIRDDHTVSATFDQADENRIAEQGTEDLNIYVPVCGSMSYNYYIYECPHLTQFDSDAVREGLLQAAQNMEPYFTFYVDPQFMNVERAANQLFRDAPHYFFNYISYVNNRLYSYEIDDNNVTYYVNADRCSISVELRYL